MTDNDIQADEVLFQTEAQVAPSAPVISAEAGMGWVDWAVMAAVLAAALWYLYRSFWANRGACGGCSKGKGKGGCAAQRSARGDQQASGQEPVQVAIDRIRPRER